MKEYFIKCDCGDPHHQIILNWDDETSDKGDVWGVYAEIHLKNLVFGKDLKLLLNTYSVNNLFMERLTK